MKMRLLPLILITAALLALAACSAAPTPLPATPAMPPTQAPTQTITASPSATPQPTSTPPPPATHTVTPTRTLTVTPSATPKPAFTGFQVEYAEYTKYGLNLTFRIPGIKQSYRLDSEWESLHLHVFRKNFRIACTVWGPSSHRTPRSA